MSILLNVFLLLHFVGFAALFGGAFVQLKGPKRIINPAMWHGALTMIITGLLLVSTLEMFTDATLNHMKIGIKLAVLIAIFVLVIMNKKKDAVPNGQFWAIAALTLLNAGIAVFV